MSAIDSDELLVIGKITTVYGVKGWVKIHSFTDPVDNLASYKGFYLERPGLWEPIEFDQIKHHGKGLIGLIEGIEDRDSARSYCHCNIAVPISEMAELDEGEFYWHQLEGLRVWTIGPDGRDLLLGSIDHMMDTGANDVLVVKATKDSIDKCERLIPYLPEQVVKEVNIDTGIIRVDWDPEF